MANALKEKKIKRNIKDKVKKIIVDKKQDLSIEDIAITGDNNRHPKFPCIVLDFESSKDTEGKLGPKRLWKMDLGIVCFIRENDYDKAKRDAEEIVGMASDFIIDILPLEVQDVHEVRIAESSEDTIIDIDNKTVVGNAMILEIYYFI